MFKKIFGGGTGITAVLEKLRQNPADAEVQENAWQTLPNILTTR